MVENHFGRQDHLVEKFIVKIILTQYKYKSVDHKTYDYLILSSHLKDTCVRVCVRVCVAFWLAAKIGKGNASLPKIHRNIINLT